MELWSAAGAEPSPALPLVFEEPILCLEHGEKLPAFGRRGLKLANEALFVTLELIKVHISNSPGFGPKSATDFSEPQSGILSAALRALPAL